ncbi:MAG: hypothetical protein U0J65_02590 [Christensenellales bacterium]|nr:hypothetical protein [Christensenellales bacterium]
MNSKEINILFIAASSCTMRVDFALFNAQTIDKRISIRKQDEYSQMGLCLYVGASLFGCVRMERALAAQSVEPIAVIAIAGSRALMVFVMILRSL